MKRVKHLSPKMAVEYHTSYSGTNYRQRRRIGLPNKKNTTYHFLRHRDAFLLSGSSNSQS